MSRWHEQFQSHPFLATWKQIGSKLNSIGSSEREAVDLEKARLLKVYEFIDAFVNELDPELVPQNLLQPLHNFAQNTFNEVNAYIGNGNVGHLQNANNNIDQLLVQVSHTPFLYTGARKQALTNAAKAYSATIDGHISRIKEDAAKLIAELDVSANGVKQGVAEANTQLGTLKTNIDSLKQNQETVIADFNKQFQASEKSRDENFLNMLEGAKGRIDKEFESLATKAGVVLDVLMKLQSDAQKVYEVVIGTAQAGAYSSYALQEKKVANRYRAWAIILMILAAALLAIPELYKIIEAKANYVLDWRAVLGRVPLSGIFLIPAFYLAHESNRHRGNELINKRRELILSTLDPYLALLDDERRNELKAEIAKSIFSENLPEKIEDNNASNLLAQISNLLNQFRKS